MQLKLIRRLFSYTQVYVFYYVLIYISVILISLIIGALGNEIRLSLESGFISRMFSISILVLTFAFVSFVRSSLTNTYSHNVKNDIKCQILEHCLRLDVAYHDISHQSHVLSLIRDATESVRITIVALSSFIFRNVLIAVIALISMITISLSLFVFIIAIFCVFYIPLRFISKKTDSYLRQIKKDEELLDIKILDVLNNVKVIYAYNKERAFQEEIKSIATHINLFFFRANIFKSALFSLSIVVLSFSIIGIQYFNYREGNILPSDLVAFGYYALALVFSMAGILRELPEISRHCIMIESIFDFIDSKSNYINNYNDSDKNTDICSASKITIEFDNVSLNRVSSQGCDDAGIVKVNFKINSGEFVAIKGSSGRGKTAIFELLMKFYKPQFGTIRINGIDIWNINTTYLRNVISYADQGGAIFHDTVLRNISLLDEDINSDILKNCFRISSLDNTQLQPDCYLSNNGRTISGGERQKIVIARALYANRRILLLDEATSAIDLETEREIVNSIRNRIKDGEIVIAIAHKGLFLTEADRIIEI